MEAEAYEEMYRLEKSHWWYQGMREITNRILNDAIHTYQDLTILDAGCGTGGNLNIFPAQSRVVGIDYSTMALTLAGSIHSEKLAQATVEQLPYAAGTFDLVTCFDVLCCREVQNDTTAVVEFSRVLRPGGYLFIRLPAFRFLRGPHDIVVHGARRYSTHEIGQMVSTAGLVPLRTTYLNSILMPLIFLSRQLQNLSVRLGSTPHSDVNQTSRPVNALLRSCLILEARWIAGGHNLPFGVSAVCLARKPSRSAETQITRTG